jgi:hypothetical protein
MAKPLLQQVGGTDLMALLSSIIVCGFVVDLSPLSTTGAVFIANCPPKTALSWAVCSQPSGGPI